MEAESLLRVSLDVHGLRERDVGVDRPGIAHLHLGEGEVFHLGELSRVRVTSQNTTAHTTRCTQARTQQRIARYTRTPNVVARTSMHASTCGLRLSAYVFVCRLYSTLLQSTLSHVNLLFSIVLYSTQRCSYSTLLRSTLSTACLPVCRHTSDHSLLFVSAPLLEPAFVKHCSFRRVNSSYFAAGRIMSLGRKLLAFSSLALWQSSFSGSFVSRFLCRQDLVVRKFSLSGSLVSRPQTL